MRAPDTRSGESVSFDIFDADRLDTVTIPILSLGKMVRGGFEFHFDSVEKMYAITPDKQTRFRVELGDDDIVRLPHEMRQGSSAVPIPRLEHTGRVRHAKRVPEELNGIMLHDIFCHRSMEKIYRTLQNTFGYDPIKLPDMWLNSIEMQDYRKKQF